MNKDCTLFLSTYDGGEDLWEGFFKALSVQWSQMDMPIIMNTETKSYSYPGYEIKTFQPSLNKKQTWAERLIDVLNHVETEYVLLFLEDFWLDKPVDDAFFRKTLQWMKENPDVANFSYYPCAPGQNLPDFRFERFERRPQSCLYKFNCQVGLWRTKELISYLRPHESPWDWEIYGSMRASRIEKHFYSLRWMAPLVFSYTDNTTGCVVRRGKWVKENVMPLVEMYNLKIDFSKRGFDDFSDFQPKAAKPLTLMQRLTMGNLYGRIRNKIHQRYNKWLSLRK